MTHPVLKIGHRWTSVLFVWALLTLLALGGMEQSARAQSGGAHPASPSEAPDASPAEAAPDSTAADSAQAAARCAPGNVAPDSASTIVLPKRVVAYYFHQTIRCPDCVVLEAYAKDVIEEDFAREIAQGRLVWRLIDFELPENAAYVAAYGLERPTLLLSRELHGEEVAHLALDGVWDLIEDPLGMTDYIRLETETFLDQE